MEDKNPYELDTGPVAAPHPADVRRAQFAQANASLALEGMPVDAVDLAIQEAVIAGTLTPDEAVAKYLERARGAAQ
ncbi:antitoxin VbhA family protein [Hydrogenophaga sp. NFH-34]|uniref:antitoxin VbhA family protein n=1 Tax=Hydrogenophaga sp. NFH-34 TaxID=2744446 RepID=UPI001F17E1FE|nr:antitoxin VbhA family protein [Hydrogenophaga sp. NFH-34]